MVKISILAVILVWITVALMKWRYGIRRNAFIEAARNGDESLLRNLLHKGINVNIRSRYIGWTGLMYAAYYGHMSCVRLLLDEGADVNKGSKTYWRLMFLGHTEMRYYGVEYKTGRTALMNAALKGHLEIVDLLIANGADVNAKTNSGWTALMAAASEGHTEVERLLMDHGADMKVRENDYGLTASDIARQRKHVE